ncbi:uncharacterized protein LOC116448909 [Corvus moneduloides]|nr:uncharacterized protein LOC116448909 [Corvus moneduloides]
MEIHHTDGGAASRVHAFRRSRFRPCDVERTVQSAARHPQPGHRRGPERLPGPRCHQRPGPFTRRLQHTPCARALGAGERRRFPSPPQRCPQLPPARSGDHGAEPGRPPRPGPRGHGHPRARAPSLSSARKASRRRSKRGARSRWPRVRAAAVTRAAARMGRDSESRSTSRGLDSSSNSARSSAMTTTLARPGARASPRTGLPAPLARGLAIGCAAGGACAGRGRAPRGGRAAWCRSVLGWVGPGRACWVGLASAGSGGAAMSCGGTLSILRSDSYAELSQYRDQHFRGTRYDQERLLRKSCTLYVGNLSFYTTEEQIHELFGKSGDIKKVIMGLDKVKKTACGFCFVEYYARGDAENAMRYINGTRLDDRIIRTDWDAGFKEGRQYGRGRSGGQVRDEYRQDYDAGRGGYGKTVQCQ